jgi:tetratricopeptide (TPR) repeat protein
MGSASSTMPHPYEWTDLMPSVTPGNPDSAVEIDAAPGAIPIRPAPVSRSRDEGSEGVELGAIALARVRESAVRNTSASELFDAGRYDDAVPLFEQALTTLRVTLGGEHPDTLTVAGNLGVAYIAAGNRRKGLKLLTSNLGSRARVLGDDHPDTLTARNALAAAHRILGDADTAISLAKQVVLQRSRTLGPTHVDTLSSRMGLALALAAAGDGISAHRMLTSTMNDAEETLGPDHPHTVALVECGESNGLLRREF